MPNHAPIDRLSTGQLRALCQPPSCKSINGLSLSPLQILVSYLYCTITYASLLSTYAHYSLTGLYLNRPQFFNALCTKTQLFPTSRMSALRAPELRCPSLGITPGSTAEAAKHVAPPICWECTGYSSGCTQAFATVSCSLPSPSKTSRWTTCPRRSVSL